MIREKVRSFTSVMSKSENVAYIAAVGKGQRWMLLNAPPISLPALNSYFEFCFFFFYCYVLMKPKFLEKKKKKATSGICS